MPQVELIDVSPLDIKGDTAVYLLRDRDINILVESGSYAGYSKLGEGLKANGLSIRDIDVILLTHIHLDHAGAAGYIVRENPRARVYVHPRGLKHLAEPSKLWESTLKVLGESARVMGEPMPISEDNLYPTEDGMKITLGDIEVTILHTPGHATHHQVFLVNGSEIVFTGDAAGIYHGGHLIPTSPPPHNPDKTIKSIERIMEYRPRRICFTHYGCVEDYNVLVRARDKWIEWRDVIRELYMEGQGLDECYKYIIENDPDASWMDKYYKSRGLGGDEIKIDIMGFIKYFEWLGGD